MTNQYFRPDTNIKGWALRRFKEDFCVPEFPSKHILEAVTGDFVPDDASQKTIEKHIFKFSDIYFTKLTKLIDTYGLRVSVNILNTLINLNIDYRNLNSLGVTT